LEECAAKEEHFTNYLSDNFRSNTLKRLQAWETPTDFCLRPNLDARMI
jgi:hypothetical protein